MCFVDAVLSGSRAFRLENTFEPWQRVVKHRKRIHGLVSGKLASLRIMQGPNHETKGEQGRNPAIREAA